MIELPTRAAVIAETGEIAAKIRTLLLAAYTTWGFLQVWIDLDL
jgi:hypothetical protein